MDRLRARARPMRRYARRDRSDRSPLSPCACLCDDANTRVFDAGLASAGVAEELLLPAEPARRKRVPKARAMVGEPPEVRRSAATATGAGRRGRRRPWRTALVLVGLIASAGLPARGEEP